MNAGAPPAPGRFTPGDGNSVGMFSSDRIGGFGYGVGVSVGILLLITTITLASYFCTRVPPPGPEAAADADGTARRRRRRRRLEGGGDNDGGGGAGDDVDVELGIDEATLKGYPEVVYGEARKSKNRKLGTTCTCCSVCLDNYGDGDVLRMLPDCGHLFHRECVDPWLRKHPTCPVCRTSPLPSPLPTPLAEVTPLAMTRLSS
ncbi:putative RING-H2 finger protein ATL71 [Hordeum vulgare]|nr:putative RING-H2 finger protein ATL71 [Hordeum vulgare]